tara:strand:- start:216 stop:719 length:504 start_codon:yes stop_codon:yes gene_type:complete
MHKLLLIIPFFATACGSSFEPMSGNYLVQTTILDDGCEFESEMTEDTGGVEENITSVMVSEDGTMVTLDETTECVLDGVVFSCTDSSVFYDASMEDETMSAVFSSTMQTDMEWTSADMIDGEMSFSFSCEGEDCMSVVEMTGMQSDCTSLWSVSLEMVSDSSTDVTE